MSSQQQNLSDIEKSGLEYADFLTQNNDEEFSIREFAFKAREGHIEECWPFEQKYLRLCLDNGINITNVLPPMVGCSSPVEAGKTPCSQLDDAGKASKPGVDLLIEDSTTSLSGKLGRLSLDDDSFKREKGRNRKTRKTRSLAEILAVAEPCILYCDESVTDANEVNEDCSSKKKHKGFDGFITGQGMNSGDNEQKSGGCNMKAEEGCPPSV